MTTMIVSQLQSKSEEELLGTPIISNRSVPKDLNLESMERFSLDSPASALTEKSNSSAKDDARRQNQNQTLTFRFSCMDEEPIVLPRSRLTHRDLDAQDRERGGLSRSKSPPDAHGQRRNDRRRRRRRRPLEPLSLLSSITTLITNTTSGSSSKNSKDKENREDRLVVGRTAHLIVARDILSCWARDLTMEIFRRLNSSTGAFWFLPNAIAQTIRNHLHNGTSLVAWNGSSPLSAGQEYRNQWKLQKQRRNRSFRRRREQPICVSGLPNQGQTCFLNSVLQSLAALEPFLEYLEGIVEYQEEKEHVYLSSTLSQDAVETGPVGGGYHRFLFGNRDDSHQAPKKFSSSSFSKELLDILKGINHVDGGIAEEETGQEMASNLFRRRRVRRNRLDPKSLLHKIAKTNPQFSSYGMYEQQDAQELFASLMGVVIHDSQLDESSSDRRMEVTTCFGIKSTSERGGQPNAPPGKGGPVGMDLERDEDDEPITLAFAHSELTPGISTGGTSPKLLDGNQISTELTWKDDGEYESDDEDETNILSLSGLLLRIDKEKTRFEAESNRCSLGLTTPKNSFDSPRDYQNNFLEEKKQEHIDSSRTATTAATTTVTDASNLYRADRSGFEEQQGLLSPNLSRYSLSSGKRRMRSTMSPVTPSPLSGWLGSTLRCSKCKHVRPIQNAPFLDIPLVPTSVPNYLSGAYQKSTTKPASPNSSRLPSCSLETCLGTFTSVENVDDVECRSCTIQTEIDRLEEEAMMLNGAVETTERRIMNKAIGNKVKSEDDKSLRVEFLEETKCLREDLLKVQTRLTELKMEDPDQDDGSNTSQENDVGEDEEFFFGATDPRDKTPMQRCEAKKCLLLTRTPSVLCCHIQRRYYDPFTGKMEKCVQFVEFPQFLDLSPYCAYGSRAITPWAAGSLPNASSTPTDLPKQPLQAWNHPFHSETRGNDDGMPYQLQSVIEHRGNAFGGHYVSYRRDHTGSWFCISDSVVTPVSWREVQTCQAYMLFYEAM